VKDVARKDVVKMAVYKEGNKWRVVFRYTNFKGERKQTSKRGFATKREAVAWEHEAMLKTESKLDMTFESFWELYKQDRQARLKETTWETKKHMVETKILPYFKDRPITAIEAKDVIAWQNELLAFRYENGTGYSSTYLKTIHAQLSSIFNHAVRFYHLGTNPAKLAGCIGMEEHKEMQFWTQEEYLQFSEAMMEKPLSYYAFEILYWCGLRMGEMLALTPEDFDFEKKTITINKSYQRLKGRDLITTPKTPKSNRVITMPDFLSDEMQDYLAMLYRVKPTERIFPVTKSYLHHEMDRGCNETGVKPIRIHDLRHSHISLLIELGFTALAIAERVGHESIDITYNYAHLFPTKQSEMANKLDLERTAKIEKGKVK